jgi:hypothetical protein
MIEIRYTTGWFLTDEITCSHYIKISDAPFINPNYAINPTDLKPVNINRKHGKDNKS